MKKGTLFVIDGLDGSGKGTQLDMLKERLPARHPDRNFVFTREPGGSPYAETIRDVILNKKEAGGASAKTMAHLFSAARSDHVEHLVLPALEEGSVVVSDRFESSTFAFQLIAQNGGLEAREIFELQRKHFRKLIPTWKTIVLDVPTEVARERAQVRATQEQTHFDERGIGFHRAVRSGFREYATAFPEACVAFVDATRSKEEVFDEVLALIEGHL